jgi:iron-sulfur cluster repair protein YtfE (RIC family)
MEADMSDFVTRDMVINDVIKKYPQTIAVFNQFRVDSCCGGGQSIDKTSTRDGVDVDLLMQALNDTVSQPAGSR